MTSENPTPASMSRSRTPAHALAWDDYARRELEQETIYLRERLRARVEDTARAEGRTRITLADLEQARQTPSATRSGAPSPSSVQEPAWPVTFGAYHVLDPNGSVAVCTLASEALMDTLLAHTPRGVAIIGRVFTENFGVEKVVANVVANPCIRVLVLCGTESRHRVGETLLALHANGVDDGGRVKGSTSPLPLVRSLPREAICIYQEKLAFIDLRGEEQPEAILGSIEQASAGTAAPWPTAWQSQMATTRLLPGQRETGGRAGRFTSDPTGFFLIGIGPSGRTIHVEHYTREGVMDHRMVGESAEAISGAIVQEELLGNLLHASYLGRELQKAETAIRLGLRYEQDRALELRKA